MKRIVFLFLVLVLPLSFCACQKETAAKFCNTDASDVHNYAVTETAEVTNFVKVEMVGGGYFLIELYPEIAPITVANFQKLVAEEFYDGLIFHRVISGFMIQGGDIDGDGYSNNGAETIKGEFSSNGVNNPLSHERGVISMARTSNPDSASTQFFIMHATRTSLDGDYAAFGRVIAGMDVVDAIAAVATDEDDRPEKTVEIASVRFVVVEEKVS